VSGPGEGREPLIARDATYHRAPDALRARVRASLAEATRAERRPAAWRIFGTALACAAVAAITWTVAITTLAYERDILTFIRHISLRNALHRLVRLVQQQKKGADPIVRQKLAALWIGEQALQLNGYRSLTNILRGGAPGPEGSTSKLFWSQIDQELAHVATEVIGPYAQIAHGSSWAPDGGQWEFYELLARASGIRAGTSEILRNILAERVLGLPKD